MGMLLQRHYVVEDTDKKKGAEVSAPKTVEPTTKKAVKKADKEKK